MLSFKTKLSYGIGGICDNTLYTLSGTYLLIYLTTVAGVEPMAAGTISAIGSIWEALVGPVVAFMSDNMESKYGRRKPFLIFAAFPIAIITSLLFTTVGFSQTGKVVYYIVVIMLYWTAFSTGFLPYMSWGADLTDDYHERTVLRSYAYVFNQVGMCIGMVLPTIIVDLAMNSGYTPSRGWQLVGVFSGVCAGASLLICALTIHKDDKVDFERKTTKSTKYDIGKLKIVISEYFSILKLRSIRYLIGASMVFLVAEIIFAADRIYFMTYNAGLKAGWISAFMLMTTLGGVVFVPFLERAAKKYEKKEVFLGTIGLSGFLMIGARLFNIENVIGCSLVCIIYALANTAYWQLMPSMIYDVCEVDELKSGKKHSGAVISFQALSESLSIAFGLQILGFILSKSGFDKSASVQSIHVEFWIENAFTFIPGLLMIIVAIIMIGYPITKEVFEGVLMELERRKIE